MDKVQDEQDVHIRVSASMQRADDDRRGLGLQAADGFGGFVSLQCNVRKFIIFRMCYVLV